MSLLKKTESADTTNDTNAATQAEAAEPQAPAPSAAATAAAALAAHTSKQSGAVAAHKAKGNPNVLRNLKDALKVDWDTLEQLKVNQGRILDSETEKSMGEWVGFQLMSYQDQWMVTPGDLKADKELLKYADNSKTAFDGTDLDEHLAHLKSLNFTKAKKQQRCIIVGALLAAEKDHPMVGKLFQMDLAPQSKKAFDRHLLAVAWGITQGTLDEADAPTMKITAVVSDGPDNSTYTKAVFDSYKPA